MSFRLKPSQKLTQRQPRISNDKYRRYVASLPCAVCGVHGRTQSAHVRYSSIDHDKRECGKGEKPSDCWCLPLCIECHAEQHNHGERDWWKAQGINPIELCIKLYGEWSKAEIPGGEAAFRQMYGDTE